VTCTDAVAIGGRRRDSVHFKVREGIISFSLLPEEMMEDERDSSLSRSDDGSGVGMFWARIVFVLLVERFARGFETGWFELFDPETESDVLSFAGPPKIVGVNEYGLTGDEDRSTLALGVKPVFWGIGANPVRPVLLAGVSSQSPKGVDSSELTL